MKQVLPILILLTVFVAPVSAALVAYDGLDHPAGALHAADSGWNIKPWDVQNQPKAGYQVSSPGLSFGSLQVIGNKAIGGDSYNSAGVGIAMPATWETSNEWVPWRKLDGDGRYKAGAEGTTLWASFLVRQDLSNNDYKVNFHQSHIAWNPGAEGASVGVVGGVWNLAEIGGGPSASTGVARVVGSVYLMVLKMEFLTEGQDRVSLYVNPTPGLGAPSVAGTTITTSKDFCLYGVSFYPGNGTNNGAMDELRFGATFADVTPIPEPASVLLLAMGAAGLFGRKRS